MKATLVVPKITENIEINIDTITHHISNASSRKSDLVIFPEACITGLINNDIEEHDLKLAFEDTSTIVKQICTHAKEKAVDIVFGYFEKENNSIFDTVLYYDHHSDNKYKYRRISNGWYGKKNSIYKCGTDIKEYKTKYGKMSFLICGDLFDDNLVNQVRNTKSDIVIIPIARCFPAGTNIRNEWNNIEKYVYIEQMKKLKTKALLVNYYSGGNDTDYFGGALVVNKYGELMNEIEILNPISMEIKI